MIERNLKTMIWMVGFFLMVGCSAGSKAVRKDREPWEENSLRQQNIGVKNGDLSQLQKNLGRANNSPKEIFYAATSETCCGEDPHAVHGIETPDGGFVHTGAKVRLVENSSVGGNLR